MVYSIGWKSEFKTYSKTTIVGPENALSTMEFLHPEEVDSVAKIEGYMQMSQGYRVVAETAPKEIIWHDNRHLPDVPIGGGGISVVSERFRDLVERFEPGVHQFIPVDMYKAKADQPIARYYWFVVCKLIDSNHPDHTTWKWDGDYPTKRGKWHFDVYASPPPSLYSTLRRLGAIISGAILISIGA